MITKNTGHARGWVGKNMITTSNKKETQRDWTCPCLKRTDHSSSIRRFTASLGRWVRGPSHLDCHLKDMNDTCWIRAAYFQDKKSPTKSICYLCKNASEVKTCSIVERRMTGPADLGGYSNQGERHLIKVCGLGATHTERVTLATWYQPMLLAGWFFDQLMLVITW